MTYQQPTLAVSALALALTASSAIAEELPGELPPAVQYLADEGFEIVSSFDAPAGMTGYAARAPGQDVMLYATPDGSHVIAGDMLDATGQNVSDVHRMKYLTEAPEVWDQIESRPWIAIGAEEPSRIVYMITDPNCPYCNAVWRASEPYYADGVQVRHVMVGILGPTSMPKAAAIQGADDPAAALARHEEAFAEGGIEVPEEVSAEAESAVMDNNGLMMSLGITGTPALFYKDDDGAVHKIVGMPKLDVLAEEVFQLPPKPIDDPDLAKFQ